MTELENLIDKRNIIEHLIIEENNITALKLLTKLHKEYNNRINFIQAKDALKEVFVESIISYIEKLAKLIR